MASETATISLRLPVELIEAIDNSAAQAGQNRTNYITSWLPEHYQPAASPAETGSSRQSSNGR